MFNIAFSYVNVSLDRKHLVHRIALKTIYLRSVIQAFQKNKSMIIVLIPKIISNKYSFELNLTTVVI